jgi:uncharacterized membrane protein YphA (DoxX/SURF4 family)
MAVSKDRTDWALLLLRLAVGGYAVLHGLEPLLHARGSLAVPNALRLGSALLEMVCGGLMIVGVWMTPASLALSLLIGWPLAHGLLRGGSFVGSAQGLFRGFVTLAAGLGGAGKWSPSN